MHATSAGFSPQSRGARITMNAPVLAQMAEREIESRDQQHENCERNSEALRPSLKVAFGNWQFQIPCEHVMQAGLELRDSARGTALSHN